MMCDRHVQECDEPDVKSEFVLFLVRLLESSKARTCVKFHASSHEFTHSHYENIAQLGCWDTCTFHETCIPTRGNGSSEPSSGLEVSRTR